MLVWYVCLVAINRRNLLATALMPAAPISSSPSLKFYGVVDTDSCHELITNLQTIDATESSESPIHLHIQSLGGDLMPMFNVLDNIDALKAPVWTYVDGYVASAASLLSVYGERRYMTKRSFILIHELRSTAEGTYSELTKDVTHSKELMQLMYDVYNTKTKMSYRQIQELMLKDIWLNSKMCLQLGLVDFII